MKQVELRYTVSLTRKFDVNNAIDLAELLTGILRGILCRNDEFVVVKVFEGSVDLRTKDGVEVGFHIDDNDSATGTIEVVVSASAKDVSVVEKYATRIYNVIVANLP